MSKKKSNYYVSDFELCGCCGEFYVSGHHKIKCTVTELKTFINNYQERLFVIADEKLNTVDLCNLFKYKMCDEIEEKNWAYLKMIIEDEKLLQRFTNGYNKLNFTIEELLRLKEIIPNYGGFTQYGVECFLEEVEIRLNKLVA